MKRTDKYAAALTVLTFAFLFWLIVNYGEEGVIALLGVILWACVAALLFLFFKALIEIFGEGSE